MNLLRHCQCLYTEGVLVPLGAMEVLEAAAAKVMVEKFVLSKSDRN